jgi:hypothetical protein
MQGRVGGGLQLRRSLDDGEPGPHRSLRVVLVRLRITKIGEHAVAHVFCDEAPIAFDQARAAFVIGCDDSMHVLGVEPRGKRRRTHEIAEHDGELPALGGIVRLWLRLRNGPPRDQLAGGAFQSGDCPE